MNFPVSKDPLESEKHTSGWPTECVYAEHWPVAVLNSGTPYVGLSWWKVVRSRASSCRSLLRLVEIRSHSPDDPGLGGRKGGPPSCLLGEQSAPPPPPPHPQPPSLPPRWHCSKTSASRVAELSSVPAFAVDLFPVLLHSLEHGILGSALRLVGLVSVYYDWMRWKVRSAGST